MEAKFLILLLLSPFLILFGFIIWHHYPKTLNNENSPIKEMECPSCLMKGGMVIKRNHLNYHYAKCKCGYESYDYRDISDLYEYLHEQRYRTGIVVGRIH